MSLIVKDAAGDFKLLEPGTYVARCVRVVDLGLQPSGSYGLKEKVYIGFEVSSERVQWTDDEGKAHDEPAFIGSRYTLSINPKSVLNQHLTSWRGQAFTDEERKGFDLFLVLGAPAMISVTHTHKENKTYANITAIMRLPRGTECPPAESELIGYTPSDPVRIRNLEKLPEWMQKLCIAGHQQAAASLGSSTKPAPDIYDTGGDFDDSIPFAFVLPTLLGLAYGVNELATLTTSIV